MVCLIGNDVAPIIYIDFNIFVFFCLLRSFESNDTKEKCPPLVST